MGLESGPQRGITIEPRSLIAAADPNVVTPTAVEALTDAFRKGVVTVDDISARADASKARKIQLQQLQQQQAFDNDPMIQEVKKTVAIASGAKARAETERANREVALAPLLEVAARAKTIRDIDADTSLDGVQKLATKFQAAGEEVPKTPEGFTDVAAARQTEEEINEWSRNAVHDAEVAKSIKWETKTAADGSQEKAPFSESLGRFLSPEEFTKISSKAGQAQTFKQWRTARQPKPVAPSPAAEPVTIIPLSPEEAGRQRANLVNAGTIEAGAGLSDAQVSELVQQRQPTVAPKVDILPAAGQVAVAPDRTIKEAPDKIVQDKPIPSEGVKELGLARQAVGIGERLKSRYEDLIKSEPNLVGFLQGRVGTWTVSRQWNEKVAGFERDATAILAPLAKGIYNETGVLSDKDIDRYRSVIPDIRDNPKVGVQKANDLLGEVFQSYANKVETWKQAGYNAGGFDKLATENLDKLKKLRTETGSSASSAAPGQTAAKQVNIPGLGVGTYRDGKFYPGAK